MDYNSLKLGTIVSVEDTEDFVIARINYQGDMFVDAILAFPFGYHSNPTPGTLVVLLSIQCSEENLVAIPITALERIGNLDPGDKVISDNSTGSYIKLKQDGKYEISTPNDVEIITANNLTATVVTQTTLTCPAVQITGNVNITGNVSVTGTMLNNGVNVGSTHVHGGVQAGPSNTGGPL